MFNRTLQILFLYFISTLNNKVLANLHEEYNENGSLEDQVVYYENLILNEIEKAKKYKLPNDFREFEVPSDVDIKDFGTFDFIVIGAGTSGAVVTNRLSRFFPRDHILVLEAGQFENDFTDIPIYNYVSHWSEYNFGFYTTPQQYACQGMLEKKCVYPRGKGVGGTSIINGGMYVRGAPEEYDLWARDNPGWSYPDLLPFFIRAENLTRSRPDPDFTTPSRRSHGTRGELPVEFNGPFRRNQQVEAFVKANQESGFELVDCNGPQQLGVSSVQVNTYKGRRISTGKAFIVPILQENHSERVILLTGSFAVKLHIEVGTRRAHTVEFTYKNGRFVAHSKKEIILSAGVIGTPQLLLLSGVGPKSDLEQLGIPLIHDLPVGHNLRDHALFPGMCFNSNGTQVPSPSNDFRDYLRQFLKGDPNRGSHLGPRANALTFLNPDGTAPNSVPQYELVLAVGNNITTFPQTKTFNLNLDSTKSICGTNPQPFTTFTVPVIALRTESVGTLKLRTASPFDFPRIDSNSLSDPRDLDLVYKGIETTLKLIETEAFQRINTTFAGVPHPTCTQTFLSKEYWYCLMRQLVVPAFHGVGTCSMGKDPKRSVVDHELKMHGIRGLRIADASVIPHPISGHPAATCMVIGEKLAQILHDGWYHYFFQNSFHSNIVNLLQTIGILPFH